MSGRFSFEVEARGGEADQALRRLLELLRGTADAALRDLAAQERRPREATPARPEGGAA